MVINLKNSKEILKNLIDYLIKKTGKKQWELSLGAGYEKETLTQMKAKPTGHEAIIDTLKRVYKDSLKNSIYEIKTSGIEVDDEQTNWNSQAIAEPLVEYLTKQLEKKDEKINELYQKIGALEKEKGDDAPRKLKRAN